MDDFLNLVRETYPVFYILILYLVYLLGIVLVWVLASYPFLIIKGAVGEMLNRFILWTQSSQNNLMDSYRSGIQAFQDPFNQLIQESKYKFVLEEEEIKINQELQELRRDIEGTTSIFSAFTDLVTNSLNSIQNSLQTLLGFSSPPKYPEPNIQVPSIRIERSVHEEKRRGLIKFLIFIPVGFFLIILNSFLLEKFFTIFTSEYIIYSLGIKYSHLIALFYSIAELALGVAFVFSKNNKSFLLMILIFISCLAFLEVYIYLYLGLQFADLEFVDIRSLQGWEILEAAWMSPFGLAISGVLFMAGHFVTDGILEYRRGQDLEVFKQELDSLHQKASDVDQFFEHSNEIAQNLPDEFVNLTNDSSSRLEAIRAARDESREPLEALSLRLSTLLQKVTDLRLEPFSQVSDVEAKRIVLLHGFFGFMIVLISFLFLTFQMESINTLISIAEIGLLLGASYLLSETLVVISSESSNPVVINPKSTFLKVICYLSIASIIGFIIFSNLVAGESNWLTLMASLFCAAGSIWLGRHLKEILVVAIASVKSLVFLILAFINLLISWGLALLRGFSVFVESILFLFTFPARQFRKKISGDKP